MTSIPSSFGLDETNLLIQLRSMNISSDTGNTQETYSLDDILQKLSEVKAEERRQKEAMKPKRYIPPGGWDKSKKLTLDSTPTETAIFAKKHSENFTISRFKVSDPIWKGSQFLGADLEKSLHRRAESDPSGQRIFSLSRESAKGVAPWMPGGPSDKDLPESHNIQHAPKVISHLHTLVQRVSKEYDTAAEHTEHTRTVKAKIASDLFRIKERKELLVSAIGNKDKDK